MKPRAFTLIELLVVISIISLLSSVVLASLNSAREKGRLGSAKYFAAQVDHVAGDQAIGIWDFDECSGSSVADRSGYGHNGSLVSSPTFSSDTPMGQGCSLNFTGTNYIDVARDTILEPNIVSVSLWIKTSSANEVALDKAYVAGASDSYQIYVDASAHFRFGIYNGSFMTLTNTGVSLNDGKWHHLLGTYDGSIMKEYIDGVQQPSTLSVAGNLVYNTSSDVYIGFNSPGGSGYYFNGSIDGVRVFAKALTASEVGKLYASGISSHPPLAAK